MIEPGLRDPDRLNDGETLIERLVAALELREASDPDSPPWVAEREIRYLEHKILVSSRDSEWPAILGVPPQGTAG